jgi:hypothetical protein
VTVLVGQLTGTLSGAAGSTASGGSAGASGNPASGLTTLVGGLLPVNRK